jgi:glycosyltransferase involved in cell wall biosynthesis
MHDMKTVCFFGSYTKTHRNNSLLSGLRENGYTVHECWDDSRKPLRYIWLFLKHWKIRGKYDVMLIGFPNHGLVPFARLITRKPIIFDPFISLHNTIFEDRKHGHKYSFISIRARLLDTVAIRLADRVIADTSAHADYFATACKADRGKFIVVPVGANEVFLTAEPEVAEKQGGEFSVRFYGTYSPLQGVQHIVRAAKLLESKKDIHFYLLGNGQTLNEMMRLAKELDATNITFFTERVPLSELVSFMQNADVCLGIFGGTVKTGMVVPHKVYDALALGKPVLTADTSAAREFFANKESILLCTDADPEDLARKIVELRDDESLRTKIGRRGSECVREQFVPKQIVKQLLESIESF